MQRLAQRCGDSVNMDKNLTLPEVPRNKKTAKREAAKAKILTATLDLIASNGLSNLSHRTIAKAAGVQLAMTTYYFGTLENIIEESFDFYLAETQPFRDTLKAETESLFRAHMQSASQSHENNVNHEKYSHSITQYLHKLAEFITDYIAFGANSRTRHLAIECQFVFQQNATETMKAKVKALNQMIIELVTPTCRQLGSTAPEIDAQLMVHIIRQFELTSVNAGGDINRQLLIKAIYRLVSGLYLHSRQASNSEHTEILSAG